MADISKITLPSGTTYDIKDAVARASLVNMMAFVGVPDKLYSGATGTTEVPKTGTGAFADGNQTVQRVKLASAATIRGTSYAAGDVYTVVTGDAIIVGSKEYVATVSTVNGTKTVTWNEFGDNTELGAWAYWNAGQVTFTPTGSVGLRFDYSPTVGISAVGSDVAEILGITPVSITGDVSQPTFTGSSLTSTGSYTPAGSVSLSNTNKTAAVSPANSGEATYTPAGTVTQPTFSGASLTSTGKFTPEGTVTTNTTENKTATVSAASSGTTTYTPAGTVTQPTFTGSATTSTGTFTATGSVAITATENKTATVTPAQSGDATYTPAGSVAAPTISVSTAGATTTVNSATKKTVVTDMSVAAPSSTTASGELVYFEVSNETLTLKKFIETTGDSVTTESKTVKTGDAVYSATAPAFTGTGVRLVTGNIPVPKTLSFTGTENQAVSVSGTPSGTVSQPTFSGTAVRLVTGNIAVPKTYSFVGTEGDVSVTGTPTGTVSKPTFTGTGVRLVTGNIAVPNSASFSGTAATISVTGTPSGTVSQPTFTGDSLNLTGSVSTADLGQAAVIGFTGTQQSVSVTKVS